MKHLRILRTINVTLGWALAAMAVLTLGVALWTAITRDMWSVHLPVLAIGFYVLVWGAALVAVGRLIVVGRGRIPQTILAVLSLPSIYPYCIYALWVVWFNAASKAQFNGPPGSSS